MHDDLAALLPDSVYHALDASSGMENQDRTACKNAVGILHDGTCSAAFGHQYSLTLRSGDHFDASKRGLALAAPWRALPRPSCLFPRGYPSSEAIFPRPPSFSMKTMDRR